MPSEEWWLSCTRTRRVGGTDPLLLLPRRVAGQPFARPTPTAWQQALQGWWSHGWRWTIQGTPGFLELETVLRIAGAPASYDTLRGLWDQVGAPGDRLADLSPTPGALAMRTAAAARTAELAGMAAIETWADLVEALERLGMIIAWRRDGETLLVVNPGLGPVAMPWRSPTTSGHPSATRR